MNVTQTNDFLHRCTGCSACATRCPSDAIHMELNEEGFYYPLVRNEKCVNCGLCERICPALKKASVKNLPLHIYSAFAKDESVRMRCSSGGIFGLLAAAVLDREGIVYGAAFDRKHKEVQHTSTDDAPLADILRSKYVQSRIGKTYSDVEYRLKNGQTVLFCGTPCQIKGLYAYLQAEYTGLVTVDFMCHGAPSTGLFKDVIKYHERMENSEVVNCTFREKDLGWRDQITKIYLSSGRTITIKSSRFYYYYWFLANYTLRRSCIDCDCYNTHEADITLADNWLCKGDDNKGISLVCINSDKGEQLYRSIWGQTDTVEYDDRSFSYDIYRHDYGEKKRNRFFNYYLKHGIEKTINVFYWKAATRRTIEKCVAAAKHRVMRILNR